MVGFFEEELQVYNTSNKNPQQMYAKFLGDSKESLTELIMREVSVLLSL